MRVDQPLSSNCNTKTVTAIDEGYWLALWGCIISAKPLTVNRALAIVQGRVGGDVDLTAVIKLRAQGLGWNKIAAMTGGSAEHLRTRCAMAMKRTVAR